MLLGLIFVLGILNMAANKAVLESGHALVASLPRALRANGGRIALLLEFFVLLGAMLLVANGMEAAGWFYMAYSAATLGAAWLVLYRRM